jgi:tau tubulin kinase
MGGPSPAVLQHGQDIGEAGRYVVRKKIGEGQFAEVYEVDDARTNTVVRPADEFGSLSLNRPLNRGTLACGVADGWTHSMRVSAVQLALKLERRSHVRTVKQEGQVLQHLSQSCPQVCKVHDSGSYHGRHFIVMDLLGPNLAEARRGEPGGRAQLATAKVVGAGLLAALEGIHRAGYIHRDVKPANFAISPPSAPVAEGRWVLIDFGLARKFVDDKGEVLKERPDASFRGSTTYASVHTHDDKDQSRRDDLWSWYYVLVELLEGEGCPVGGSVCWTCCRQFRSASTPKWLFFCAGTLPWRAVRDAGTPATAGDGTAAGARGVKDGIAQHKAECIQHPERLFTSAPCPEAMRKLNKYLSSLGFADEPDYGMLRSLLSKLDKAAASEPNDGTAPAQAQLPPRPTVSPPIATQGAAEPPAAEQPSALHPSKEQPLREKLLTEVAAAAAAAEQPAVLGRGGSGAALEPSARTRDAGSKRERDGGKEREPEEQERGRDRDRDRDQDRDRDRDSHRDPDRERDRTSHRDRERRRERSDRDYVRSDRDYERSDRDGGGRRRSRSRERRSRSRDVRSRSRDRRRSRSRGRRASSRSRSRQRAPRSRSRTRSPAAAAPRKDEPRKDDLRKQDLREQHRGSERDLVAEKKYKSMRHFVAALRQVSTAIDLDYVLPEHFASILLLHPNP